MLQALNGAEGTVPPGRIYKKVAIVENFFDIIHAVHVDLEGRPGKHAGQKRTYRTVSIYYNMSSNSPSQGCADTRYLHNKKAPRERSTH